MAQTPNEGFYAAGLMVAATCLMAGALFPGERFAVVFAQVLLGAGAVVMADVGEWEIVVGNPARFLKKRILSACEVVAT